MNMNSKIRARQTYTYPDTLFKSPKNVSGVVLKPRYGNIDDNITMLDHMFHSECGLVHFEGDIACEETIYKEVISWGRGDQLEDSITDTKPLYSQDGKVHLDFRLRFLESGEYKIYFEFYALNSQVFTKVLTVNIVDDYRNHLSMYKVRPVAQTVLKSSEEIYNILNIKGLAFQMSNFRNVQYSEHCQFLCYDKDQYVDNIGLSHTVIIPIEKPGQAVNAIVFQNQTFPVDETNFNLQHIPDFPDYWVYIEKRFTDWKFDSLTGSNKKPVLICIRKGFDRNECIQVKNIPLSTQDPVKIAQAKRYVDEFRFYPIFHELVEFDNSQPISQNDILYITPNIHHSKPISDCHWEFFNATTLKSTKSQLKTNTDYKDGKRMGEQEQIINGGTQATLFAAYSPTVMSPGYYDIKLKYKEGENTQTYELKSAFLLSK